LGEIYDSLAVGETVRFSALGACIVRSKGDRASHNPWTRVEARIDRRRVMDFKRSNALSPSVNGEAFEGEDEELLTKPREVHEPAPTLRRYVSVDQATAAADRLDPQATPSC
jgi:Bacterial DNA-binding protein